METFLPIESYIGFALFILGIIVAKRDDKNKKAQALKLIGLTLMLPYSTIIYGENILYKIWHISILVIIILDVIEICIKDDQDD